MTGTPTAAPLGAPEPAEDEASYGTRVEDAFIAERGTPFLLSPKDWHLISGWRESGIPSGTVIRAVRGAFEKKRARGDRSKISSLSYCANAVEVLWEMERRGLVGSHSRTHGPLAEAFDAAPRLRALVAALSSPEPLLPAGADSGAAREALGEAKAAVEALDPGSGLDALEEALGKVEKALGRKLEKALGEGERAALGREVEEEAGDLSGRSKETQRRILSAIRGRAVRRLFGLAPLTIVGD